MKGYKDTKITIYLYTGLKKHWQVKSLAVQDSDLKQWEHWHLQPKKFKNLVNLFFSSSALTQHWIHHEIE